MTDGYSLDFEGSNVADVDILKTGASRGVVPIGISNSRTHISFFASAFCISPTFKSGDVIFATAKHVFTGIADNFSSPPFIALPRKSDDLTALISVPIREAYCAEEYSDVALFVVNLKRDAPAIKSEPAVFKVTLGPPRVGEHCLALGFPQKREPLDYRLAASDGVIEEVHERRRDSAIVSYPSFRVGANYTPAMSGGPILGEDSRVIGVVSTGFDTGNPQDTFSYGAAIGSILELTLNLHDDNGKLQAVTVPQLASLGFIGDRGDPAISLNRTQEGVTLTWTSSIESQGEDAANGVASL